VLFAISYYIALALPNDNTALLQSRLNAAVEGAVLRGIGCCCSLTAANAGDCGRSWRWTC